MNAERRKQIDDVISRIEAIKADIDSIRDAEQEAYDNLPDSFRDGERGAKSQASIDALENIDLDDIVSELETARDA